MNAPKCYEWTRNPAEMCERCRNEFTRTGRNGVTSNVRNRILPLPTINYGKEPEQNAEQPTFKRPASVRQAVLVPPTMNYQEAG